MSLKSLKTRNSAPFKEAEVWLCERVLHMICAQHRVRCSHPIMSFHVLFNSGFLVNVMLLLFLSLAALREYNGSQSRGVCCMCALMGKEEARSILRRIEMGVTQGWSHSSESLGVVMLRIIAQRWLMASIVRQKCMVVFKMFGRRKFDLTRKSCRCTWCALFYSFNAVKLDLIALKQTHPSESCYFVYRTRKHCDQFVPIGAEATALYNSITSINVVGVCKTTVGCWKYMFLCI